MNHFTEITEIALPINMYDPTREYSIHGNKINAAIHKVISQGKFIGGPEVYELENKLAEYVGVKHCITVANGTDALQIALMSLNIGLNDEVITVAHTWISSSETISLLGAIPVFVDIESTTFNIDPTKIISKITNKTKAILVVNLYGHQANYSELHKIADKYNLSIIEVGAQSFGAIQNGKQSCSFGTIGTTSFFPTKPLGCYGDGGACFTNRDDLALKIRAIKNHGGTQRFFHDYIGVNSRLDTIQAAILLEKIKYLNDTLTNRNYIANLYTELLGDLEQQGKLILPKTLPNNYHVWAQYSIILKSSEKRNNLVEKLKESDIHTAIFYPKPLHHQNCFKYLDCKQGDLPITEMICDTIFNVPCYGEFSKKEVEYVCEIIKNNL
jgi:UDP-2-acetamido-2-deoxy-ribo-hexuluronate aminotransferase